MHSNLTGGEVHSLTREGIHTITFSHPAHNAMPGEQLQRLTATIKAADNDPEIKVIILQSGGERTFCAGASFDELAAIDNMEKGTSFFMGFAGVINACRLSSKIIIGRVQGKAVGGGVGIAAAADYCLASANASVRLSELAVGIGPFVVGPVIERKIGNAAFRQLALRANEWFSAEWAHEHGLFQDVFADLGALDQAVLSLAEQLSHFNPEALSDMKRIFWEGTSHWDILLADRAAISGRLVLSDFTRNAIAEFKKR